MKKLFFIALAVIFSCGQMSAQSIKDLWVSQDNSPESQFFTFEFKAKNVLEFTAFNTVTKKAVPISIKYIYNPQTKIVTFSPGTKNKQIFKVQWINKDKFILGNKKGGFMLARNGTDEDITSKNLPDPE